MYDGQKMSSLEEKYKIKKLDSNAWEKANQLPNCFSDKRN